MISRAAHSDAASFPSASLKHLVERISTFPPRIKAARWVIRDDNHQHYHGIVHLSRTPFFIELAWKATSTGRAQSVGRFRLNLPELLAGDFIRFEKETTRGDEIRLRFVRGENGIISIQSRSDRPSLPIGLVKLPF